MDELVKSLYDNSFFHNNVFEGVAALFWGAAIGFYHEKNRTPKVSIFAKSLIKDDEALKEAKEVAIVSLEHTIGWDLAFTAVKGLYYGEHMTDVFLDNIGGDIGFYIGILCRSGRYSNRHFLSHL